MGWSAFIMCVNVWGLNWYAVFGLQAWFNLFCAGMFVSVDFGVRGESRETYGVFGECLEEVL